MFNIIQGCSTPPRALRACLPRDWAGFYIGGHGEFSRSSTKGSTINLATGATASPVDDSLPNWRGGIRLGFDCMMPSRVVLGVEADVTSAGTKTATTIGAFGTG